MFEKRISSNVHMYIIISAIISVILFFLIFGYKPLIVTNTAFLYDAKDRFTAESDVPYHQLGVDYFLKSDWSFPPGWNNEYPYPYGSSILVSDSLPLFAFISKILAGVLPEYFQYFGLWTMLCFILQGIVSSLLLRKLGLKLVPTVCAVPLFVINVPLLYRTFHHCALCGQWLILLALLGYMYNDEMTIKTKYVFWCVLCVLCVLVQGYFLVICGAIMLAAICSYIICDKKNLSPGMEIIFLCMIASLFTYYLCGGFANGTDMAGIMLGEFHFDLIYLFDPYMFSTYFSEGRLADYNTEHEAYLGIGLIVVYFLALIILILKRSDAKEWIRKRKRKTSILFLVLFVLTIFSFGTKVHFVGTEILDLQKVLPEKILYILAMFRSTARFFWPVWYMILLCAIRILYSAFKEKNSALLCGILLLCTISQYIEIPEKTIENRADSVVEGYPCSLERAFGDCFNEKAKHMSTLSTSLNDRADVNAYAVHHGFTSNRANLGRGKNSSMLEDYERLVDGNPDKETIYVVKAEEADSIPFDLLPQDFAIYYDDEKYICFFDGTLLKEKPECTEIILNR